MMISIKPGMLRGRIRIPPSKSIAHRAVLAAALSEGRSIISNIDLSDDISATIDCIKELGANCEYKSGLAGKPSLLYINGINIGDPHRITGSLLNCRESGSTLRFIIPIALALSGEIHLTGSKRLLERPLEPYENFFNLSRNESGICVKGKLEPGLFELPGDISSQFVTGLMLALPRLSGESRIIMTSPLQSRPYVDLSIQVLDEFGIQIINNSYEEIIIPGDQAYRSCELTVEGDYSQAAFWLVANALGSSITFDGLATESKQGDKAIIGIIQSGSRVINAREIPDLVPILAVLCCFRDGESKIVEAGRLRLKESDRLHAITLELNKLGADIIELDDGLIIHGVKKLHGGTVYAHNDHRIAMALAIAATRCDSEVIIDGHECVSKSYPAFFEEYKKINLLHRSINYRINNLLRG